MAAVRRESILQSTGEASSIKQRYMIDKRPEKHMGKFVDHIPTNDRSSIPAMLTMYRQTMGKG
jgi:hypothetical protein